MFLRSALVGFAPWALLLTPLSPSRGRGTMGQMDHCGASPVPMPRATYGTGAFNSRQERGHDPLCTDVPRRERLRNEQRLKGRRAYKA